MVDSQTDTPNSSTFKAHNCMTNVIETAVTDHARQRVDMLVQRHLQNPGQPGRTELRLWHNDGGTGWRCRHGMWNTGGNRIHRALGKRASNDGHDCGLAGECPREGFWNKKGAA